MSVHPAEPGECAAGADRHWLPKSDPRFLDAMLRDAGLLIQGGKVPIRAPIKLGALLKGAHRLLDGSQMRVGGLPQEWPRADRLVRQVHVEVAQFHACGQAPLVTGRAPVLEHQQRRHARTLEPAAAAPPDSALREVS